MGEINIIRSLELSATEDGTDLLINTLSQDSIFIEITIIDNDDTGSSFVDNSLSGFWFSSDRKTAYL